MNTRKIFTASALYGAADVLVLAVSGFLLLPLYTRALTQSDFGNYIVVKTNIEILTYLLYLGLPSAVARVYFDYRKQGRQYEYMSSVLVMFALNATFCGIVLAIYGEALWNLLSPRTPAWPYLWFAYAIAAGGFIAALVGVWLRMENRVRTFVILQVTIATLLALLATAILVSLDGGLRGLLSALLLSGVLSVAVLPWLFGGKFRFVLRREHVIDSLRYAVPILVGYVAFFTLGRASTLILQRHVQLDQIAIFGLAQQLALFVVICSTAFGKALQPAVFGAEPAQAREIMLRTGESYIAVIFCVASLVVLFCADIVRLVAPQAYASSQSILMMLVAGSMVYAFSLVSDTALLYHRRPRVSAAVSVAGAASSVVLGLWLIPRYHLYGAALATLGGFAVMTCAGHLIAYRVTRLSYVGQMLRALAALGSLAVFTLWLEQLGLSNFLLLIGKILLAGALCAGVYVSHSNEGK